MVFFNSSKIIFPYQWIAKILSWEYVIYYIRLSSCDFVLINKCIISYLLIYRHILRLCAPPSLYSRFIDYWFLSLIYHTHLCTDLLKSPSDTKILAYYYPWNHFSLKVGVPDEIFGFKAEGILNYIFTAHIIAITVSHGVDLRFEPNSIYNINI